jgi:hypothetical protein
VGSSLFSVEYQVMAGRLPLVLPIPTGLAVAFLQPINSQAILITPKTAQDQKKQKAGVRTPAFLTRTKTTSSKSVDFAAPQLIAFPHTRKPAFLLRQLCKDYQNPEIPLVTSTGDKWGRDYMVRKRRFPHQITSLSSTTYNARFKQICTRFAGLLAAVRARSAACGGGSAALDMAGDLFRWA